MTGEPKGKEAALTGIASGFDAVAARHFVAEGARLAPGNIGEDAGNAIASDPEARAIFLRCGMTPEDHVAAMVDAAASKFDHLDTVRNNTGTVSAAGPSATTSANEWQAPLDVLLNAAASECDQLDTMHHNAGIAHGRHFPGHLRRVPANDSRSWMPESR